MERVLLLEENQAIGETDDGTAPTNRADHGDEGVRITEREHIDIIRDNQK